MSLKIGERGRKAETHKKIVNAASTGFRGKGLQGIGIADLMAQAGLTHGGFYAHFKDKNMLVAEAVNSAASESVGRLIEAAGSAPPGKEVAAMLAFYLSPAHRDDSGRGCPLPSLASELARQPQAVREAFTRAFKGNVTLISGYMPGKNDKTRHDRAMAMISGMAGGILLARAIYDPDLSNALLDSVRSQLLRMYESWLV